MIQVAGTPIQSLSSLNVSGVDLEILEGMRDAGELFSFPSMDQLWFALRLRKNMTLSAKEMSEGESTFRGFSAATCNPEYWYLTPAGGFLQKPNVYPTSGISDIFTNSSLYAFECATACVINMYHAMSKSMEQTTFNTAFQNIYLYSWNTDPELRLYTFHANFYLPGDVVYFNNPDYDRSNANYRGENAVAMGGGKFFGHGFGIVTAEEMIEALNKKRFPNSNRSAYLTSLVTRFSPEVHSGMYRDDRVPPVTIHHNKISISFYQYIRYLYKGR